ncbi:polysaccharide deacetylase family sporulation protein PdaB [Bacillus sp. FJAT-27445]|uniref:polysaccharide deacetylase family sporulation protein PdaB n=1 Tax=Bacillus sp. FJAT-27445 TaxID=1679166 RepID=UPI000743B4AA|nr:polysaccharide deacetylase family sporulation protein PdaB [Bacillus sp. FJAT-27445]
MNFFIVLNGKRMKQLILIVVSAIFTAWIVYMESMVQVPVFSTKEGPKAVYKGEKDIALTFNIGWGDEKAAPILDVLEKENVRSATFFLSGSWAERHPDLVSRISKLGYEIGILGYGYEDYTTIEEDEIRKDLAKAQTAFGKLNIKGISLIRPPTGHFDMKTLKIAERFGFTVVHWSVDSSDWTNPGVKKIQANINKAVAGDIVLLHASDSAKQTAKALPGIIKTLQAKGLKFVTVSEMITSGEAKTEEVK